MTFVAAFRIETPEGRTLLVPLDEIVTVEDNDTDPPSGVVHLRDGNLEWTVRAPGQSLAADWEHAKRVAQELAAGIERRGVRSADARAPRRLLIADRARRRARQPRAPTPPSGALARALAARRLRSANS